MTTPATASEEPTMTARAVRGIRSCHTMMEATDLSPGVKALANSSSVRLRDPMARLVRHSSTHSAARTRMMTLVGTPVEPLV